MDVLEFSHRKILLFDKKKCSDDFKEKALNSPFSVLWNKKIQTKLRKWKMKKKNLNLKTKQKINDQNEICHLYFCFHFLCVVFDVTSPRPFDLGLTLFFFCTKFSFIFNFFFFDFFNQWWLDVSVLFSVTLYIPIQLMLLFTLNAQVVERANDASLYYC